MEHSSVGGQLVPGWGKKKREVKFKRENLMTCICIYNTAAIQACKKTIADLEVSAVKKLLSMVFQKQTKKFSIFDN